MPTWLHFFVYRRNETAAWTAQVPRSLYPVVAIDSDEVVRRLSTCADEAVPLPSAGVDVLTRTIANGRRGYVLDVRSVLVAPCFVVLLQAT